jgi:hypothetical protein
MPICRLQFFWPVPLSCMKSHWTLPLSCIKIRLDSSDDDSSDDEGSEVEEERREAGNSSKAATRHARRDSVCDRRKPSRTEKNKNVRKSGPHKAGRTYAKPDRNQSAVVQKPAKRRRRRTVIPRALRRRPQSRRAHQASPST